MDIHSLIQNIPVPMGQGLLFGVDYDTEEVYFEDVKDDVFHILGRLRRDEDWEIVFCRFPEQVVVQVLLPASFEYEDVLAWEYSQGRWAPVVDRDEDVSVGAFLKEQMEARIAEVLAFMASGR